MRTLLHAFSRDHHRTIALIDLAKRELTQSGLVPSLAELGRRLREHFRLEEALVFATVENLVEDPQFHVTATLRREHQAMRTLLADVDAALALGNRAGAIGNLQELSAALATHERKEHDVLFPMAERLALPAGGSAAMIDLGVENAAGAARAR